MNGFDARSAIRMSASAALACGLLALASPASAGVDAQAEQLRSYSLPDGVSLRGAQIDSRRDGTTLIANSKGRGENAACAVVLASGDETTSVEYQHEGEGTGCTAVHPGPQGGFFVRGIRAQAGKGDVGGFTARVAADGSEEWYVDDRDIARGDDFLGSYEKPHDVMAYSEQSGSLLVTTLGKATFGDLDEKAVTNVSVVSGGVLSVDAKTIGRRGGGFGKMGGAEVLRDSGAFLVYLYVQARRGAEFLSYDGRQSVELFEPMGENWRERFVEKIVYGPGQRLHLLWTDSDEEGADTKVSVVDQDEEEIWSRSYPATVGGGEGRSLGDPEGLWVGSEYSVVLYRGESALLRVVDVESGRALGVAELDSVTEFTPYAILNGREGRLKLLALNRSDQTIVEYRLNFEETTSTGPDAGTPDGGSAPGVGEGGGGGGCQTSGGAGRGDVGFGWLLFSIFALARWQSRLRPGRGSLPKNDGAR